MFKYISGILPSIVSFSPYIVGLSLLICSGYLSIQEKTSRPSLLEYEQKPDKQMSLVTIDVSGGVLHPGLYKIIEGATISDAILVAGGFSTNADISLIQTTLNLGEKIEDRQKVNIPQQAINNIKTVSENELSLFSHQVSINDATSKELTTLTGIGEVRAQKIIDNRPYQKIYELVNKSVITEKMFEILKNEISL